MLELTDIEKSEIQAIVNSLRNSLEKQFKEFKDNYYSEESIMIYKKFYICYDILQKASKRVSVDLAKKIKAYLDTFGFYKDLTKTYFQYENADPLIKLNKLHRINQEIDNHYEDIQEIIDFVTDTFDIIGDGFGADDLASMTNLEDDEVDDVQDLSETQQDL